MGCALACLLASSAPVAAQEASASDSISIRIVQTDLRSAVQILAQYLDRPVIFVGQSAVTVTLETPRPVPRTNIQRLLSGLLDGHGYELVDDTASGTFRARPREVARPQAAPTAPAPNATRGRPAGDQELFVIALRHARAVDVAATVGALYGSGPGSGATEAIRPTLGDELRANLVPPTTGRPPVAAPPAAPPRVGELSGEITVVPDARANRLLLRAVRSDYELVRDLVERIDVRPLQVLIEVLIAEVRRDHSLGIAVEGVVKDAALRGTGLTVAGALVSQGLGDFAMTVMGLGGTDAEATLSLAAQRGEVRILSRPVVLATNNQIAEIVVGSQRPFVQVQRALPTDAASRDQIVQYKEVGTKLMVVPSISEDGAVHLTVSQEVSNATTETAFNAPVISTRSVSTQLLVQDGQTVALGGLTDRQRDVTRTGLPVLSSLPLIGGLFGSATRRTTETELFVFLTPRVVRTDDDAMRVTAPYQERAERRQP